MGAQWKQKGREAAADAKGRVMTRLSRELSMAARGGTDPTTNARLRMAMDAARKASMSRDTLDRAIKRGAGLDSEGVVYETIFYEGFAPYQVPVVVECLTENRNRTAANIKVLFRKGQMANTGAVTWDFARLGAIEAAPPAGQVDPEEAAIEAGAQDLEANDDGTTTFYTDPGDLDTVSKALTERRWSVSSAKLIWRSKNPVSLDDDRRAEVEAFLHALDGDDDVQSLYVGLR